MSAPRAFPGEDVTALKWNEMAESVAPQSASRARPRLFDRLDPGDASPSFWVYQEAVEPYKQRVRPGWICVEGGTPFLPSPMEEIHGCLVDHGKNVYLNLYTKQAGESTDPSTSPLLGGEYPPGSEAAANVSTEPGEQRDGYTLTVITLSIWQPQIGSMPAGPQQNWASDIFITAKGTLVPSGSIPVYVRTHPETGWGPDENYKHDGLECLDESDPTKWQYALALRHAHEQYSYVEGQPAYQLGGVYTCRTSGATTPPPPGRRPYLATGEIVFPLANQDTSGSQYVMHTYGDMYALAFTDELEPYIQNGIGYIPRCNCGSGVGSGVDPSGGGSYNTMGGNGITLPTQPENLTEQ